MIRSVCIDLTCRQQAPVASSAQHVQVKICSEANAGHKCWKWMPNLCSFLQGYASQKQFLKLNATCRLSLSPLLQALVNVAIPPANVGV